MKGIVVDHYRHNELGGDGDRIYQIRLKVSDYTAFIEYSTNNGQHNIIQCGLLDHTQQAKSLDHQITLDEIIKTVISSK